MLPLRSSKVIFWTAEEFPTVELDCILEGDDEEFVGNKEVLQEEEPPVWLLFSSLCSVQGFLLCKRLEGCAPPPPRGLPLPVEFPLIGLLKDDNALCFLLAAILEEEHLEGGIALLRDLDRLEIDIGWW